MDVPEGDTKSFNEEVDKRFQSTVYLEKVWNESGSYHFQFNIQHNLKAGSGKFLSQYHITNRGGQVSLVSKGDIIQLYDRHNQIIKPTTGSRGSGPGEIFSSSFDRKVLQSVKEIGLRLRVYEYEQQ
ncbi:hypothetical protein GCM10008986_26030 [Salinibacillus aidingensis]|uniref:Uncharacterized protein n=1 Tax=Salinibacillus aidingensis TaxID=237684 RepID=A0ABN1BHG3_9BACI